MTDEIIHAWLLRNSIKTFSFCYGYWFHSFLLFHFSTFKLINVDKSWPSSKRGLVSTIILYIGQIRSHLIVNGLINSSQQRYHRTRGSIQCAIWIERCAVFKLTTAFFENSRDLRSIENVFPNLMVDMVDHGIESIGQKAPNIVNIVWPLDLGVKPLHLNVRTLFTELYPIWEWKELKVMRMKIKMTDVLTS